MRVVLDTNVIVAGLRSPNGASAELLRLGLRRRFTLLASVPPFAEYEAVALRREHLKASGLRAGDVAAVLDALALAIDPVPIHFLWRPRLRDPNDEMVMEAAVNGRADALVTFNLRDFAPTLRFGVLVETPRETLERYRHEQPE